MNWRVISNSDSGYSATFPDKPVVASRDLNLAGLKVPLTLQAAVVDGAYFAVGVVELKGDLASKGKELNDALIQALANNVKVDKTEVEQKPWAGLPTVDWVNANGTLPDGSKARAVGRFFQHQNKVYEVILVGPDPKVDSATVTQFFSGFKLLGL
jgi:outer membrane murein-binding lipoprotein Lpp